MKIRYLFCAIFAVAAVVLAATTIRIAFENRDSIPVLVSVPQNASARLSQTFDSICSGEFAAAEELIYGHPSLGVDREPEDEVSKLIWNAFVDSLEYELAGECYATEDGLAQDVTFHSMDISSVTANLRERSRTLLELWVEEAEDMTLIYDENHEYREDLVMEALKQAAQQAIVEDAKFQTDTITVRLIFRDGQWWVLSDDAFLEAISGGIA